MAGEDFFSQLGGQPAAAGGDFFTELGGQPVAEFEAVVPSVADIQAADAEAATREPESPLMAGIRSFNNTASLGLAPIFSRALVSNLAALNGGDVQETFEQLGQIAEARDRQNEGRTASVVGDVAGLAASAATGITALRDPARRVAQKAIEKGVFMRPKRAAELLARAAKNASAERGIGNAVKDLAITGLVDFAFPMGPTMRKAAKLAISVARAARKGTGGGATGAMVLALLPFTAQAEEAEARGPSALNSLHRDLMKRDARYRRAVESAPAVPPEPISVDAFMGDWRRRAR